MAKYLDYAGLSRFAQKFVAKTSNIADRAVTTAKLADGSITNDKLSSTITYPASQQQVSNAVNAYLDANGAALSMQNGIVHLGG